MVNRKYTEEFKSEAVKQARERGCSVQEVLSTTCAALVRSRM